MMNILHISEKYELNELEKQIVQYMQDHIHELKSIGIRQMAKDNYTSTSTIYKLCNKFGFDGYSDMIYHLTSTKDTCIDNNHYSDNKEQFHSLLQRNKRIVVSGFGFSGPIADYIAQRLILLGYQAMSVIHMEMLDPNFMEDTVLIVISYSGQTPRLDDIVKTAYKKHIPIISFIANKNSCIYQHSSLPILIGEYDSFVHDYKKAHPFFGEVIIAFESLIFD